jgi:uncharacterized repeat protein (TIGR03803 family)
VTRLLKTLALFLATATLSCLHAQAQDCGPWLNVTSWQVTYTITGAGSGSDGKMYNWTISHQMSANAQLTPMWTQCAAQLEWAGYPTSGSGSVNDFGTGTTPCPSGGDKTLSFEGGGALVPNISGTFLTINPANNTYTFLFYDAVPATNTESDCSDTFTFPGPDGGSPFATGCPDASGLSFPLPESVEVLTQTNFTFTADANCPPWPVPVSWTLSFTLTPVIAQEPEELDLHDFDPGVNTGKLAQGRDGNFYGESQTLGSGTGSVFNVTPTGTFTVIHNFDLADGALEAGGMTLGTDGYLYGNTYFGGTDNDGVTFKITTKGVETVLHNFTDTGDGSNPVGALVLGTDGDFYGTTVSNPETIYKVSSSGKFTKLQTLTTAQGYQGGQLIQASDGNFYSGTNLGGANNFGTAFKMTPAGAVTVLHGFSLTDGADASPGMVEIPGGTFIGTAARGGNPGAGEGVIYSLTSTGTFAVLHVMNGPTDGSLLGVLMAATDGNLYGTAANDGASSCGTIFKVTPLGQFSLLYTFDGPHGCNPEGYLTQGTDGKLYGITSGGGANDAGTLFSLNLGLSPFVQLMTTSGKELSKVEILGQGFSKSSVVEFGGVAATTIALTGTTYIDATVPAGALSGPVTVNTGTTTLTSPQTFKVLPTIATFDPPSGPVGTIVTINGTGLTQTDQVTFDKVPVLGVTRTSDTQISVQVPVGAKTGKIAITTNGGTATSSATFTVN